MNKRVNYQRIACVYTFSDKKLSLSANSNTRSWNSTFSHVSCDDVIKSLDVKQVLASDVILATMHCNIDKYM